MKYFTHQNNQVMVYEPENEEDQKFLDIMLEKGKLRKEDNKFVKNIQTHFENTDNFV